MRIHEASVIFVIFFVYIYSCLRIRTFVLILRTVNETISVVEEEEEAAAAVVAGRTEEVSYV